MVDKKQDDAIEQIAKAIAANNKKTVKEDSTNLRDIAVNKGFKSAASAKKDQVTGSIMQKMIIPIISNPVFWGVIILIIVLIGWFVIMPYFTGCPTLKGSFTCIKNKEGAKAVKGEFSAADYDTSKTAGAALKEILGEKNEDEDLEKAIFYFDAQVDEGSSGTVLSTDVHINNFYTPESLIRDGWTSFDVDLFLDIQNTGTITTDYDLIIQCSSPRAGDFDVCSLTGIDYTCGDAEDESTVWKSEWDDYDSWIKGLKPIKLDRGVEDTIYCTARFGTNSQDDTKDYDNSEFRNSFDKEHGTYDPTTGEKIKGFIFDQDYDRYNPAKEVIYGSSIISYDVAQGDALPSYLNGDVLSWCHTVHRSLGVLASPDKFGTFSATLEPVIKMKKFVHARKSVSMMDLGYYLKNSETIVFSEENTRNTESPLIFSFIAGGQPKIVDSIGSTVEVDKLLVGLVEKGEGAATNKDLIIVFLENRVIKDYKRPYKSPEFDINVFESNNFGQSTEDWVCSRDITKALTTAHFNNSLLADGKIPTLENRINSLDIPQEAKESTIKDVKNLINSDPKEGVSSAEQFLDADPDEFFFCIPTSKGLKDLEGEKPVSLDIVYKQFEPSGDTNARFEGLMIYDYFETGLSTELKITCTESKFKSRYGDVSVW